MSTYPCQMAKQIVTAGLKWPPDVDAQVMIAKAIPKAYAQPICISELVPYFIVRVRVIAIRPLLQNIRTKKFADLEDRAESRFGVIQEERSLRCNSRIDIEEYTQSFCCHLSHPAWPSMLEIQFSLRYWLWFNHVSFDMSLHSICIAYFHVSCVEPSSIVASSMARVFDLSRIRHCERSTIGLEFWCLGVE
jgi:hypothetical protein